MQQILANMTDKTLILSFYLRSTNKIRMRCRSKTII